MIGLPLVMIALVAGGTRNCKDGKLSAFKALNVTATLHTSSAANLRTAVKGVFSGTLSLNKRDAD